MKSWPSGSLLVAGLLLGSVAAACGGGGSGELSLEQYFEQVDSIVERLQERTATLDQPLEQDFDSEEEQIEAFRDAFSTVPPIFRDFVDDLDELNPSAEVADAHGELVAGFVDLVESVEGLIDQLAEVEALSEMQELFFAGFGSAIGQLAAACLELQSVADDNDIDVDLMCAA